MIRTTIAILAAVALTGACATTGTSSGSPAGAKASRNTESAPLDLASSDFASQGLRAVSDGRIPSKECGMVLWSLEGTRPAAVFQFVSGKNAEVNIAGNPVRLTRTDYSGAAGFGVYERQYFESAEGVSIEVTARFGLEFSDGAYLEQGLIKISDSAGWSMVTPAAGIAGCRP